MDETLGRVATSPGRTAAEPRARPAAGPRPVGTRASGRERAGRTRARRDTGPWSYDNGRVVAALGMVLLFYLLAVRGVALRPRKGDRGGRAARVPVEPLTLADGDAPAASARRPEGSAADLGGGRIVWHDVSAAVKARRRVARAVATGKAVGAFACLPFLVAFLWPGSPRVARRGAGPPCPRRVGAERGSALAALGLALAVTLGGLARTWSRGPSVGRTRSVSPSARWWGPQWFS